MRDDIVGQHGAPTYLPFQYKRDRNQLSFMSNYFTKLPKVMVDLLFGYDGLASEKLPHDREDDESINSDLDGLPRSRRAFLKPFRAKADTEYAVSIKRALVADPEVMKHW